MKNQGKVKAILTSGVGGGLILMLSAVLAMGAANSPLKGAYESFVHSSHLFVNDFLMAIFFLYAGLEIKRELKVGALKSVRSAMLPAIAAACGMALPALVYLLMAGGGEYARGWAIPAATDIAFALGVLALLGKRVPGALKVLLMAIAVIDDLGAILVIVFFYTSGLFLPALGLAAVATAGLVALNHKGVQAYTPYVVLGLLLWVALFKAGVHPTIGGVILGFCVPMTRLRQMEHGLEPWVAFGILPLFGFVNAGVSLAGMGWGDMAHPVTLGIGAGLVLGKLIGVSGAVLALTKSGLCPVTEDIRTPHIIGLGCMCGIGFTMALFIGGLAFPGDAMAAYVRMGVMGGSVLSGLLGYTVLYSFSGRRSAPSTEGL